MAEMKGIKLCGECGNYNWKKHKCKIGCDDDSNAQASFYGDCPLPDVAPRAEVAREILAELESELAEVKCFDREFGVYLDLTIAQLKKKYTEAERD